MSKKKLICFFRKFEQCFSMTSRLGKINVFFDFFFSIPSLVSTPTSCHSTDLRQGTICSGKLSTAGLRETSDISFSQIKHSLTTDRVIVQPAKLFIGKKYLVSVDSIYISKAAPYYPDVTFYNIVNSQVSNVSD